MSPKEFAATKALSFVSSGMTVGLGSGSTAEVFVKLLAVKSKRENLGLKCVIEKERRRR